jgi:hypothetical protein
MELQGQVAIVTRHRAWHWRGHRTRARTHGRGGRRGFRHIHDHSMWRDVDISDRAAFPAFRSLMAQVGYAGI